MIRRTVCTLLDSANRRELPWCIRLQDRTRHPGIRLPFRVASRLGNGIAWYALMAALPAFGGRAGLRVSLHLALTGLACLAVYRATKAATARPRPCAASAAIRAAARPLDRFSFPSGHTLQAVALTTVAVAHYPSLGVVLIPFCLLVAASRVVLGLHYPSDVLAGAVLGFLLSVSAVLLFQ